MAAAGLGSRRAMETRIKDGSVLLNDEAATIGQNIKTGDRIKFQDRDFRVVADSVQHRTLIYNKPEGELTTRSDPQGRPTVFDSMPFVKGGRWIAVGRLDINTTGLLILTTDGELAHAMMHPSNQVDREYVCRIRGEVSDQQMENLHKGVELKDGPAHFSDIKRLPGSSTNQWFQVTILEGRNREVRRLWESQACMVSRLKRVRYGAATLPKGLRVGRFSEISTRDHHILREDVKLKPRSSTLSLRALKSRGKPGKKKVSKWKSRSAKPRSKTTKR